MFVFNSRGRATLSKTTFHFTPMEIERRRTQYLGKKLSPEHLQAVIDGRQAFNKTEAGKQFAIEMGRRYAFLTDEQVLEVFYLAATRTLSQRAIAKEYGVPASTVSNILTGKAYKHVNRPKG